jgi:hypothetical protein
MDVNWLKPAPILLSYKNANFPLFPADAAVEKWFGSLLVM